MKNVAFASGLFMAASALIVLGFWSVTFFRTHGDYWAKAKSVFLGSLTVLVARLGALSGIILSAALELSDNTTFQEYIKTALEPKYIPVYIILSGILIEFARRRTLDTTE
jgi:hypothetical protein